MVTNDVRVATRVTLAAAATMGVYAFGGVVAGAAPANAEPSLVGTWLGPALGDAGRCGSAFGQYTFNADSTYRYMGRSSSCAGVDVGGHYALQPSVIVFTDGVSCTALGCAPAPILNGNEPITWVDANDFVLEGRYLYHRQ